MLESGKNYITFKDLKNGDVVQWRNKNSDNFNNRCNVWSESISVIINKDLQENGQVIDVKNGRPQYSWFYKNNSSIIFRKYVMDVGWVETRESIE